MIKRDLFKKINPSGFPVVIITGPRQSGKTTMAQACYSELPYVNFESPLEVVDFRNDPKGFIKRFPDGAIIDEAQHVPELSRYLQVQVDADKHTSKWVLTGSQQLELGKSIDQSLAGRSVKLELLPFSYAELGQSPQCPLTLAQAVLQGGYPALYDESRAVDHDTWLNNYIASFINTDIRNILEVKNRGEFVQFLRICATLSGCLLNEQSLSRACGVGAKTINTWLHVLESCYIIRLVRPYHKNYKKRLVKSPKLHFIDTGIACRLLKITDVHQLMQSQQWGGLVESWCFSEMLKFSLHNADMPDIWHWSSSDGHEVDLIHINGQDINAIEVKANNSADIRYAAGIVKFIEHIVKTPRTETNCTVIYGGEENQQRTNALFVSWKNIAVRMEQLCI